MGVVVEDGGGRSGRRLSSLGRGEGGGGSGAPMLESPGLDKRRPAAAGLGERSWSAERLGLGSAPRRKATSEALGTGWVGGQRKSGGGARAQAAGSA